MIKKFNKTKRQKFCRLAVYDSKKAAEELHSMADALSECNDKSDIIFALSEILFVSERTIFYDLS